MTVENVTYISDLDATYPAEAETSTLHEGNDHIRNIKKAIKNTFPNVTSAVTASAVELNFLDGVSSNIQTQINAKSDATHDHDGGTLGAVTLGDGSVATTQAQSDNSTKIATTAFVASAVAAAASSATAAWANLGISTASATTDITLTTPFDGTLYDHYQIIVDDLNTEASAVVQVQVVEASAAMATASAYSWAVLDSAANATSASASSMPIGAKNISACAFVLDVSGLHITAVPTALNWQWTSGKKAAMRAGGGARNVAAAGEGVKIKASTGNISGEFIVLGRRL